MLSVALVAFMRSCLFACTAWCAMSMWIYTDGNEMVVLGLLLIGWPLLIFLYIVRWRLRSQRRKEGFNNAKQTTKIKGTLKTYLELLSRKSMISNYEENLNRIRKRYSPIFPHAEFKVEKKIENSEKNEKVEMDDLTDAESSDDERESKTEIQELNTPPSVTKTTTTATGTLSGYTYTSPPPEVGFQILKQEEKIENNNNDYLLDISVSSHQNHQPESLTKSRMCSIKDERISCQEDLTVCVIL